MSLCTNARTKGFYFGYFWAYYMSAMIVGNGVGSVLIKDSSGPTFSLVMWAVMIVGLLGFFCLKHPHPFEDKDEDSL